LKAIARVVDMELSERIPLFFTDEKLLENVRAGCCVPPTSMMRHASEDFSLEDFALGSDESACSKESGELPLVLEYIENTNLEKVARHHLRGRDMKGE